MRVKYRKFEKYRGKTVALRNYRQERLKVASVKECICIVCGKAFDSNIMVEPHKTILTCSWECRLERMKKLSMDRIEKKRRLIMEHYSGNPIKCQCCGESNYVFLTIDHIVPLSTTKTGRDTSYKIIDDIIKNNFPDNFQILCYNCNYGKRAKNDCPHKLA